MDSQKINENEVNDNCSINGEIDADDEDDIDDTDEDDSPYDIPKKGIAIEKLIINPAMLDQDSYANVQCYSPVYSIKSYASNNVLGDNSDKIPNVANNNGNNATNFNIINNVNNSNNNVNNKGKSEINKSPQNNITDLPAKPILTHNGKQPSISSLQSPYTPLLSLNSPIVGTFSGNSTSSSPLSNETTPKIVEPIQIINGNNADVSKSHSLQTSPFLNNVPPQNPVIPPKTSLSAPSTTTSTPTTINVKKNLQSPSVLFQNKTNKLLSNGNSNINVHSHVNNGKKKGVFNQLPVIFSTRNTNIRKKTVDNHSTPMKGMIRKLSINPIDKHNIKEGGTRQISPYKTHFYSISCPQNNSYKKSYINIKELFDKVSQPTSFDNNNDKIKLRKPGSYSFLVSNNKRPITVNNLHLYEKEALEREINDVIHETIQCLDAYHALFSDVMIPSQEKGENEDENGNEIEN